MNHKQQRREERQKGSSMSQPNNSTTQAPTQGKPAITVEQAFADFVATIPAEKAKLIELEFERRQQVQAAKPAKPVAGKRFVPESLTPEMTDRAVVDTIYQCTRETDPAAHERIKAPNAKVEVLGYYDISDSADGDLDVTCSPDPTRLSGSRKAAMIVRIINPDRKPMLVAWLSPQMCMLMKSNVPMSASAELGYAYRMMKKPHDTRKLIPGIALNDSPGRHMVGAGPTIVNRSREYDGGHQPFKPDGSYGGAKPGEASKARQMREPVSVPASAIEGGNE